MTLSVGDLLEEFRDFPKFGDNFPVLTLTERKGFVPQKERFNKRIALEDTSKYKIVREGNIAYNPYLLWSGAIAQRLNGGVGVISPLYPTFTVRAGFDARFVGLLLSTKEMIQRYDHISTGSIPRRRRASVADFLALSVPDVPPREEQCRIAATLDAASKVNVQIEKSKKYLDNVAISIVSEASSRNGEWSTIGDSLVLRSGLTLSSADRRSGPFPVYGANGIIGAHDRATHPEIRVTIGRVGAVGAINVTSGPAWISDNALIVEQAPDHLSPIYLSTALRLANLGSYASRSAQPLISQKRISEAPLWVPAVGEAHRIDRALKGLAVIESRMRRQEELARSLFASLQSRAFRGEL